MEDIITKKTTIRFVRDYSKRIIIHYKHSCSHLELDHVEANGAYVWGRTRDNEVWILLAEVHEKSIIWLDNRNALVPYFGNMTYH